MKNKLTWILICFSIPIAYIAWQIFGGTVQAPVNNFFYIKSNDSYRNVVFNLKQNGVLKTSYFFEILAKRANYPQKIKAGRYEIKNNMSVYALLKMLKQGNQAPVKLVINKLRIKEDLGQKIIKNFDIDSTTVTTFLNSNDSLAKYGVDTNTLISMLIPNTYTYNWNTSMPKIFAKLKAEQQLFWNVDRKEKAAKKNLTTLQVYTLASIVEEETNKAEDKPLIASVYSNRLQRGEKLQADPTVKYAMKDFGLKRILYTHLKFASPYNTYYTTGLPPGPICTPSALTIDAVLNAPTTNYMFFVAKPDFKGYSNFAETYEQHQIYAKQYQQALNEYLKNKDTINR